jgi:alkaline phosphatase D
MPGLTRREWLRAAGAGAALAALPGCGDDLGAALGATFDVDAGGAVLSVAPAGAAGRVRAEIADAATGDLIATAEAEVGPGGTARLDVVGLAPDRRYTWTATCDDGSRAGPFAFATPPATDRPVRLAFSADLDVDPMWDSPILDHVAAAAPELFVSIGDFPYADDRGETTLADYRAVHRDARGRAKIQRWLATSGVRAIYDDHEVRNDWDGATWVTEGDRVRAALTAWDEWFPVRGTAGDVRYRAWSWGPLVDGFLLDCRRFRSPHLDPDGPDKTMLGATQRDWLIAGVTASSAPFKLVFTSVPLDFGYPTENWAVYRTERDAILAAIRDAGTDGVLFLTADQHWFASHEVAFGAREMQVGPLARGLPDLPPAVPGVLTQIRAFNFGVLDVAPGDPPLLTFTARGADGGLLYEEGFAPADLRLR